MSILASILRKPALVQKIRVPLQTKVLTQICDYHSCNLNESTNSQMSLVIISCMLYKEFMEVNINEVLYCTSFRLNPYHLHKNYIQI